MYNGRDGQITALLKIREEKSKKQFNSDHTMFEDKNIMKIEEEKNSIQIGQCLRATVSGRWWSVSLQIIGMTIVILVNDIFAWVIVPVRRALFASCENSLQFLIRRWGQCALGSPNYQCLGLLSTPTTHFILNKALLRTGCCDSMTVQRKCRHLD